MRIPIPRCSSLDRIVACPGSILPTDGPREAGGADATLGTAKHEALAHVPKGTEPNLEEIAARHGVDMEELVLAVKFGRQAWEEIGQFFPSPMVERKLKADPICVGTMDVGQAVYTGEGINVSIIADEPSEQDREDRLIPAVKTTVRHDPAALRLADWKTGRGTDLHPAQLKGYAIGMVAEFGWPANDVVTVFEIWTRHRRIITTNVDGTDLEGFRATLLGIIDTAISWPSRLEYAAGGHCKFCPHRPDCQVRAAWLRDATTALVAVDHKKSITVEMLGRLYVKAKEVDRAMRQFWKAVDSALDDGPIPLPNGQRVERVETEREKIAAGPAIGALMDRLDFGTDDREALLGDVAKSAIDRWAKGVAVKGKRAALLRDVYTELRGAGAIRTEPHFQKTVLDG